MSTTYSKTIRVSQECRFWLDEILEIKRERIKELKGESIPEKFENILRESNEARLQGLSVKVTISATVSSVIAEAIKTAGVLNEEIYNNLVKEMEEAKKNINIALSTEGLTPNLCLFKEDWEILKKIQYRLKGNGGHRVPRESFVIKLLVFKLYRSIKNSI